MRKTYLNVLHMSRILYRNNVLSVSPQSVVNLLEVRLSQRIVVNLLIIGVILGTACLANLQALQTVSLTIASGVVAGAGLVLQSCVFTL